MSSTIVRCNVAGCGEPAAYKIAAPWSDGAFTELKTYGHACSEHLGLVFREAEQRRKPTSPCRARPSRRSASTATSRANATASSSGSGGSKKTIAPDRSATERDRTMIRHRSPASCRRRRWRVGPLADRPRTSDPPILDVQGQGRRHSTGGHRGPVRGAENPARPTSRGPRHRPGRPSTIRGAAARGRERRVDRQVDGSGDRPDPGNLSSSPTSPGRGRGRFLPRRPDKHRPCRRPWMVVRGSSPAPSS